MNLNNRISVAILGLIFSTTAGFAQQCATGPVTVGLLPKLDGVPFFDTVKLGAEEAQKEIGGKVVQQAPQQPTADSQIEFINNMVSQKFNVIAISGNDVNAVAPALRRAKAQGVWIMSYDSDVAPNARSIFINQAESDSIAAQLLQSIGTLINFEGEFAILSSTPTAPNQNSWIAFIKQRLASDSTYAKMKLVQVAYGEENEQVNQQQTLALTQAFPNLKGIIVPAGQGLPTAARALEQAGLIGKIKLTGLAPASLMKKYIMEGASQDVWWNVEDEGYLTYYAAQALAQCKITGKQGETFKAGRLGEYTIGANGEIILGKAAIVTPENVNSFKF